jgi:hypothetical protein
MFFEAVTAGRADPCQIARQASCDHSLSGGGVEPAKRDPSFMKWWRHALAGNPYNALEHLDAWVSIRGGLLDEHRYEFFPLVTNHVLLENVQHSPTGIAVLTYSLQQNSVEQVMQLKALFIVLRHS